MNSETRHSDAASRRSRTHGFHIHWVLQGELALGPAPHRNSHLEQLERQGLRVVLSLCYPHEWCAPDGLEQRFRWCRRPLPDHHTGCLPTVEELASTLALGLQLEQEHGPVFVHCVAAMERSPLLCLAWLMCRRRLSRLQALDYLMEVHPGTNPLAAQLSLLDQLSQ